MLSSTTLLKGDFTFIRDSKEGCKRDLFCAKSDVLVEKR